MGLSGKYWPSHPKPFPDELFSSWLIRVAQSNHQCIHTFCHLNWPHKQIWTRDIDVFGHLDLLETLAARTGVNANTLKKMNLSAFVGTVLETLHSHTTTYWVMPVGVYHRTRTRFGLQWCPACLLADEIPYYRRHWRMAFSSCCPKHGILLADRCYDCGSPSIPHKGGLTTCHDCSADLKKHPQKPALSEAIQAEYFLNKRAIDGKTLLPSNQPIFSVAYFDIWHRLLTLVAFGRRSAALRKAISDIYGGNPCRFPYTRRIEFLPPYDRNRLMDLTCKLFPGWPFRLISVALKSRNWASYVLRDMNPVRYALWEVMKRYASGSPKHFDKQLY